MLSFLTPTKVESPRYKGPLLSAAGHLALGLLLVGGVGISAPKIAPYRLPGTALGVSTLTYYSPGSPQLLTSESPSKSREKKHSVASVKHTEDAPQLARAQQPQTEVGVGTSARSGLGEGDITIALQTYFPYPKVDLSALPHGTKGDVILDAVIDEHGKIAQLTLLKGLGSPIDQTVIATVQSWSYTPAMKNGVAVSSEQELHFHYERG
jgi:periplasmic protein TonB